ncbi:MAG: LysR substrate-binding domain-containing protein [Gammaproteobacteria bacterium]
MNTHLPTIKQLRYLLAIEKYQHFGRAAESCHVSQSAFSSGIQELEAILDVQLVDRTNRQVTITHIGGEIADQARLCLRDVEFLVEIARGGQVPLAGPLRLGVIPTIAPFLLPTVLPPLRAAYPDLKLFLHEEMTHVLQSRLMDGSIDLALLALPFELRNVEVISLFEDPFRLAAREGTTLVDPEHFRFNRLTAEVVLMLENGHCMRDHALDACRIRNTEKVSRFAATSLLTLIEMVDADLGVTFLPEMAEGSAMLNGTQVRTWPLQNEGYREIALAWRKGSARGDEFRELGEFIKANRSMASAA